MQRVGHGWIAVVVATILAASALPALAQAPKTKSEAATWLRAQGLGADPDAFGLVLALTSKPITADIVRAYLLVGASATKPLPGLGDTPLSALAAAADGHCTPGVAEAAEVLLAAGASVNAQESSGRRATVTMAAVTCLPLLKAVLAHKPNLDALDARSLTAMHYAIDFGKPRDEAARLLMAAGFNLPKWRDQLLMWFSGDQKKIVESLGKPAK